MRRFRLALVGLAAVTAFLLAAGPFSAPASAASFLVDSTADAIDANPGDGVCDDGAGNCTLRAAIQETNALISADTISLPAGTYILTISGNAEDAAATGDLDITDDLTITGAGASSTIVDGGALDTVFHILSGPTVKIEEITITNGSGVGYAGGITNEGTLELLNSAVTGNAATASSGGIINLGTMIIDKSTVSGNTAGGNAGGIRNFGPGSMTITNSTISGNTADGSGGGFSQDSAGATSYLNNVTITDNTSDTDFDGGSGGGVEIVMGTVDPENTIIAGNTDNSGVAPDCSGTLTSQDYNLIQNTTGCTITGTTTHNITGVSANLGPLADNGGGTLTHAFLPTGSPAIDAGSPTTCEATDQRGVARPQGAACDIGAYEAAAPTTCPGFPPGETHDVQLQLCFDDVRLDSDGNGTLDYSSGPVCFTGTGKIWRSDPYVSGGYCTIDKEIKSLYLTATVGPWSAWLKAGTEQGLGTPTTGTIVSLSQVPGEEFPADNDWEVYFEIGGLPTSELQNCDLDPVDGTPDPATLVAQISAIPPYNTAHQGSVMPACDGGGTVRAEGENAEGEVSPPVGGVVETLDGSAGPDPSVDSSSGSGFSYTALGGALAAVAVAVAACAWFARRRWAR